jgi:1,4-alpha-glucan branching enzyme
VNEGVRYKYEIVGQDGVHRTEADPYALRTGGAAEHRVDCVAEPL